MKKLNKKLRRIFSLVLDDIMMVYPYLVLFYCVSLGATLYFKPLAHVFYWTGFTAIIVVLGAVFIVHHWRKWLKWRKRITKGITQGVTVAHMVTRVFNKNVRAVLVLSARIRVQTYIKVGLIFLVLMYLGFYHVRFLDLVTVLYALIVLLFGRGARMSSVIAFLFLLACPVLLWFHFPEQISTNVAVYAYYFLIICLLGHIRPYLSTYLAFFH